jgi:glyoxylase-like metal-dependent hydrolase (beta-lactamase superfamily II)
MAVPDLPAGLQVFERGWLSANNILFTSSDNTLLVDSGYCTHAEQTLGLVESALGARPLDTLVNTHLHSDHCGGNAALQARYPKLQTFIPPGQAQQVAEWDPVALTYLPTGQLCPQFSFTQALKPGSVMQFGSQRWELHSAPGHDPHSLVFFEPIRRVLISADALWENGFGVVFPELEGADAFADVSATLDLIERLAPETVIPGHGRVFAYAPEIMTKARQRLDSFVSNPARHAHHAAKVLLKFKLLETQRQDFDEFVRWVIQTPYFSQIKAKFFADVPIRIWIEQLSAELVSAGVARKNGPHILNS